MWRIRLSSDSANDRREVLEVYSVAKLEGSATLALSAEFWLHGQLGNWCFRTSENGDNGDKGDTGDTGDAGDNAPVIRRVLDVEQ